MFLPVHQFRAPAGSELLTELGIDPTAVREVIEDERALRCPERIAQFPTYGFASLCPEPSIEQVLRESAPEEHWDPVSALLPPK